MPKFFNFLQSFRGFKKINMTLSCALGLVIAVFVLAGCSSMSTLPKEDNVKVSRNDADKKCEYLGKVEGRTQSKKATEEDTLKDMKQEAANKGANFLVVKEFSALGTSATGLAYKCP